MLRSCPQPDMLNLVAAGLGGAVDALEVSKLLVRCGAVQDEAAASKAARAAAERAQLVRHAPALLPPPELPPADVHARVR